MNHICSHSGRRWTCILNHHHDHALNEVCCCIRSSVRDRAHDRTRDHDRSYRADSDCGKNDLLRNKAL